MYRVKINNKQKCALGELENILDEVKTFIDSKEKLFILEKIEQKSKPVKSEDNYTQYNISMEGYVNMQVSKTPKYNYSELEKYINPSKIDNDYQHLLLNRYREVDKNKLKEYLKGKGVLEGQEDNIIKACKKYNIDVVYFLVQSILETGHGKSKLAMGNKVSEIADENSPILNGKGEVIGYNMINLGKTVTVYNLYGIGAKDGSKVFKDRALILGIATAYNKGWTSIEKAIEGAAEFVSSNYIHSSKFNQNTIYKYRFNPVIDYMWHQYSTTNDYASKIADLMKEIEYLWMAKPEGYDYPKYK